MKKYFLVLIIFVLLVAAGGGIYWFVLRKPAKIAPSSESAKPSQISWQFEDMGEASPGHCALTKVKVGIEGKIYDLGTYDGRDCSAMAVNRLSENEISGMVCWCAGGEEIGVFKENGKLVVKSRGLTESPYYPDTDFKEILEIK